MDSQRRMVLAVVLSAMVIFGVQLLTAKPGRPGLADGGLATAAPLAVGPATGTPDPAGRPSTDATAASPAAAPQLPHREVTLERPFVRYVFSSEGGGLTEALLLGRKMREQQDVSLGEAYGRFLGKKIDPAPQMNMAQPVAGESLPLAVSIEGNQPFPATTRYAVEENAAEHKVTFHATAGGWDITKTLAYEPEGFELSMLVTVKNLSAEARSGELAVHTVRSIDPSHEKAQSFFGGVGNQSQSGCAVADDYDHEMPKDKPPVEKRGLVHFFGIDQQYFLTAVFPLGGPREGRCTMLANPNERRTTAFFPLQLAPGQSTTQAFGVFMGPKDSEVLPRVPSDWLRSRAAASGTPVPADPAVDAPHLERTLSFGIWAVICKVLLVVLKFFHGIVGNWGLAIICLTVAVKLLLTPFTHKAMVGQEAMRKLQPRLEALKKKFPDDKERIQMETMKIYQEEKVNPFGSCLLLVVQMPVWFALYSTLRNSYEIYDEPFFGSLWTDLTSKDPTYLLPIFLGISQIITTRLQPQMMDAAQARIMNWMMPIFFTAIMLQNPMGLALYIFTNNVLTVAQQYFSRRVIAARQVVRP